MRAEKTPPGRQRQFATVGMRPLETSHEEVMERLLSPSTWPSWQPEVQATQGPAHVGPGDDVWGRATMLGFVVDGRSLICEVGPGTMEQDVIVGVRMRVRFRIVEGLGGPILEHSLQTSLPGGVLGRVLSFFLRPRLRAMQRVTLRNLVRV